MHVSEKTNSYNEIKSVIETKNLNSSKISLDTAFLLILMFVNIEKILMHGKRDNGSKKVNYRRGAQQSI